MSPKTAHFLRSRVAIVAVGLVVICAGCSKQDENANTVPPPSSSAQPEQANPNKVNNQPKAMPVDGLKTN